MLLTSRARLQWSTEREAEQREEATGTSKPSCPLQQMCLYLAQVAGVRTEENGEEATTAALRKSMTDWLTNNCWPDVHICVVSLVWLLQETYQGCLWVPLIPVVPSASLMYPLPSPQTRGTGATPKVALVLVSTARTTHSWVTVAYMFDSQTPSSLPSTGISVIHWIGG